MGKVLDGEKIELQEDGFFTISYHQKLSPQNAENSRKLLEMTRAYWEDWAAGVRKYPLYQKEILRSALVLKLMSYDHTGAIVAAVTTSIPETIGEGCNWDYRFCWLRDSSMAIRAMTDLDRPLMAQKYTDFILNIATDKDERLQIMYGIRGERRLTEKELTHLAGYMNSQPVRIGNAAYTQVQNDVYGVLMDVILQQFRHFEVSRTKQESLWTLTRIIANTVGKNWFKPDKSIWELRKKPRHFVFSKVLCWVAIDRAIQVAELIGMYDYVEEWLPLRKRIKRDILPKGWNEDVEAFTQSYDSMELDASVLLMETYGFIEAGDYRYVKSVHAIKQALMKDGLMFRYRNKGDFGIPNSSFTICTFWMIDALYNTGQKEEARQLFESLLGYSNHLGLFIEDIDFTSKRLLGNFPQTSFHLALIETAVNFSGNE